MLRNQFVSNLSMNPHRKVFTGLPDLKTEKQNNWSI